MGKKTWLSIHPINFSSDKMVHTYVRSSTLHVGEILHFKHAPISAVNRMASRVIREKITTTKQQSGVFFIAAVRKWEILAATEVKVNGSKKKNVGSIKDLTSKNIHWVDEFSVSTKKIWVFMHPRNFGSHATVRPSVRITGLPMWIDLFLTLCGACNLCLTWW